MIHPLDLEGLVNDAIRNSQIATQFIITENIQTTFKGGELHIFSLPTFIIDFIKILAYFVIFKRNDLKFQMVSYY